MNKKNTFLITLAISFIVSCSKPQPTELEKARIKPMMASCMIAVTRMPGSDDAPIADAFSMLGQYIDSSGELLASSGDKKTKWELLNEEPRKVNMEFSIAEVNYSCDLVLEDDWVINEVRRNDEVVFNLADDIKIKEENERIKEEERLAKIRNWEELEYSNVSYNYYKKRHTESEESLWGDNYVKFNCQDDGFKFKHEGLITGKRDAEITIKLKNQEPDIIKDLVIDDYGYIGREVVYEYSFGVDSDKYISKYITTQAKDIEYVIIEGYTYNFDDVSQVKCLE